MSTSIEAAIKAEDWTRARRLITSELRRTPRDHWLLTRLAATYCAQRRDREALALEKRALRFEPACPLVLWDYAGTLDLLGRYREALRIYRKLLRIPLDRLANGPCGEGLTWARGLQADCHFRRSSAYLSLGQRARAHESVLLHLSLRGPGCRSIYSKRQVTALLKEITTGAA